MSVVQWGRGVDGQRIHYPRRRLFGVPGIAVVDQSVASIALTADENYQVTLGNDNNGMLKNGNTPLPYTIKYNNGSEITLSTSTTTVETGASVTDRNRSLTVFIGASASIGLPAGA